MAVITANQNPTLLDLAKRTDPNGGIADIIEILNQTNEILTDMSWVEGNLTTGHRTTIRTGLPIPTWRQLYGGVQPSKGTTTQVDEGTGMIEAYAEIDKALADLNGNAPAFRLSEEKAHMEGINQALAQTIFYGDEKQHPERFTGFAPRFNSMTADNSDNIIDAGGTGSDNGSIWLVVWGELTCNGIVPKGSTAGMQRTDKGQETVTAPDGGKMEAYVTHYRFDAGLSVRDWRYVVRIANIDRSLLSVTFTNGSFSTGANLPNLMFQAIDRIPDTNAGRAAFYMDRGMLGVLRQQLPAATNGSTLAVENVGGKTVNNFQGIPIRRCDALAVDEAQIQ